MTARLLKHSRASGETIVEYVLMLALIFLVVVFASVTIGERVSAIFNHASDALLHLVR